jgi:hypothetical protein
LDDGAQAIIDRDQIEGLGSVQADGSSFRPSVSRALQKRAEDRFQSFLLLSGENAVTQLGAVGQ